MKILILTLYFAPDVGANAVILTGLARQLAGLGHQVTVVTAFPHYAGNVVEAKYRGKLIQRETWHGIDVVRTYLYASKNKKSFVVRFLNYVSFNILSTLAGLFSGPQDLILAPSPPLTVGLSAILIGWLKRIPRIYNVQDINPDVLIKLGILRNPLGIAFSKWLERFVYRHSTHLTVLSDGFRDNLLRKGVPAEKISVIPNFVDIDFVRPLPQENGFRAKNGFNGQFLVTYAGNLGHSQNLEHLLDCAHLLREHQDLSFVIVGNGSRKPFLLKRAEHLDLPNVRFLPFQPLEDVPEIYAASDVSLVTLRKEIALDSVPSKAYTIMASGRPVLAAVDPGSDAWKLVETAACGLCVEPENPAALAEAVLKLRNDAVLRRRMGEQGRAFVEAAFTPQIVAARYHQLFTALAGQ